MAVTARFHRLSKAGRTFGVSRRYSRRGAIVVMAAFLLVVLLALVAFSVDIGALMVARCELKRTADAAALAAAWELIDEGSLAGDDSMGSAIVAARDSAMAYAGRNAVLNASPGLNLNSDNAPDGEVVIGYIEDFSDPNTSMQFENPRNFNAVTVKVCRTTEQNGKVPFFFARVFGFTGIAVEQESTAAILKNISGFKGPADGSNLPILPITVSEAIWDDFITNGDQETGMDDWTWDLVPQAVEPGSDGIKEINIYPQDQGAAGNFGTLKIGTQNNSTSNLGRQIQDGINAADLSLHGGELALDTGGELILSGNPGISAGIKDDLASIIGEPRIIPIHRSVTGSGSNAEFVIVKFVGVRIMEAELSSGQKRLIVQPANVITKGAIAASSGSGTKSNFIYAASRLVK
jgi:Flp pilus assembly protein TadG